MITRVEFTLDNWTQIRHHQDIHIKDIRGIFPEYEVEFIIYTDIKEYPRTLHEQQYEPGDDHFHLREWFEEHEKELKPLDKLAIEIIEPMHKYRLEIVK